jgi:hypothetical protein
MAPGEAPGAPGLGLGRAATSAARYRRPGAGWFKRWWPHLPHLRIALAGQRWWRWWQQSRGEPVVGRPGLGTVVTWLQVYSAEGVVQPFVLLLHGVGVACLALWVAADPVLS